MYFDSNSFKRPRQKTASMFALNLNGQSRYKLNNGNACLYQIDLENKMATLPARKSTLGEFVYARATMINLHLFDMF